MGNNRSMANDEKFITARLWFAEKFPYLSHAAHMAVTSYRDGIGTAFCTDDWRIFFDPEFVKSQSVEELGTALYHEISHLLYMHGDRAKIIKAENPLWNLAGDAAINSIILADSNCKFGIQPVTPKSFNLPDGLTAEEYYRSIKQITKVVHVCMNKDGCGSGAGAPNPNEPAQGDKTVPEGRGEAEIQWAVSATAKAIKEHQQSGSDRGKVPGGWQRWAEEMLKPSKVPWQQKLAKFVKNATTYRRGAFSFSYSRPARRQVALGYGRNMPIYPALIQPKPDIMVVADTSGSMGQEELGMILRETREILKTAGDGVVFAAIDTAVHAVKPVATWQDASKLLIGGGGTDFSALFDSVDKMRPRPEVIVFCTDGCAYGIPETPPPGINVVWVLTGKNCTQEYVKKWGDIVVVD